MNIKIKNIGDRPLYQQIKIQIEEMILSGALKEGEELDSISKLAKKLQVSVITIQRVYEELEKDGYIGAVPNKGFFVLNLDNEILRERTLWGIDESVEKIVRNAKVINLEEEELLSYIGKMIKEYY